MYNVLRESLSEDSQNIPCATLKRRGSWVMSIYLWLRASSFFCIKKDILGRKKDDQRPTIRWFMLYGVIKWFFPSMSIKNYSITFCEKNSHCSMWRWKDDPFRSWTAAEIQHQRQDQGTRHTSTQGRGPVSVLLRKNGNGTLVYCKYPLFLSCPASSKIQL